jgi:amino-acid N-acetyltransferase
MNAVSEYKLIPAGDDLKKDVIALLKENDLPTSDLDSAKDLFALLKKDAVVGTGGLEFFSGCALLRSVSVRKDQQGKGLGRFINHELEKISKQRRITCLYLLTTTAKEFFEKEGYGVISREETPLQIKSTSEFSSLCPASAIVMKKTLS